jgi:hypothetical protein
MMVLVTPSKQSGRAMQWNASACEDSAQMQFHWKQDTAIYRSPDSLSQSSLSFVKSCYLSSRSCDQDLFNSMRKQSFKQNVSFYFWTLEHWQIPFMIFKVIP